MTVINDDKFCLNLMLDAHRALCGNKEKVKDPQKARAWAITVTELEKTIAYFETFVMENHPITVRLDAKKFIEQIDKRANTASTRQGRA